MRIILLSIILIFFIIYPLGAQDDTSPPPQARYVLVTINNAAAYARTLQRKVPAIVLDSYLGIVWRCPDLQDEKPKWIKTDLGKIVDKTTSRKKYVVQIPAYPGYGLKIPAIVLDIEDGKTWNCPDITSEDSRWIEKNLKEDKVEGAPYR